MFLIYSCNVYFQFLPDQSITPAFAATKQVLKQMLFIAFPLLPLRLSEHSLTVLPQIPSAVMPKLTIFRLLALCLLSWSGALLFFSVLSFTASLLDLSSHFLHLCKTLQ